MMLLYNGQPIENKGLIRLLSKAVTFASDVMFREIALSHFVQVKQWLVAVTGCQRQLVTEYEIEQQNQYVSSVCRAVPPKGGRAHRAAAHFRGGFLK